MAHMMRQIKPVVGDPRPLGRNSQVSAQPGLPYKAASGVMNGHPHGNLSQVQRGLSGSQQNIGSSKDGAAHFASAQGLEKLAKARQASKLSARHTLPSRNSEARVAAPSVNQAGLQKNHEPPNYDLSEFRYPIAPQAGQPTYPIMTQQQPILRPSHQHQLALQRQVNHHMSQQKLHQNSRNPGREGASAGIPGLGPESDFARGNLRSSQISQGSEPRSRQSITINRGLSLDTAEVFPQSQNVPQSALGRDIDPAFRVSPSEAVNSQDYRYQAPGYRKTYQLNDGRSMGQHPQFADRGTQRLHLVHAPNAARPLSMVNSHQSSQGPVHQPNGVLPAESAHAYPPSAQQHPLRNGYAQTPSQNRPALDPKQSYQSIPKAQAWDSSVPSNSQLAKGFAQGSSMDHFNTHPQTHPSVDQQGVDHLHVGYPNGISAMGRHVHSSTPGAQPQFGPPHWPHSSYKPTMVSHEHPFGKVFGSSGAFVLSVALQPFLCHMLPKGSGEPTNKQYPIMESSSW